MKKNASNILFIIVILICLAGFSAAVYFGNKKIRAEEKEPFSICGVEINESTSTCYLVNPKGKRHSVSSVNGMEIVVLKFPYQKLKILRYSQQDFQAQFDNKDVFEGFHNFLRDKARLIVIKGLGMGEEEHYYWL